MMEKNERLFRIISRLNLARMERIFVLLIVIFSSLAIFVPSVNASGIPSKLIVFTDKKVYTPITNGIGGIPTAKYDYTDDFSVFVYAIVLDDDANIIKGRTITGYVLDSKVLEHQTNIVTPTANDLSTHNSVTINSNGAYWGNLSLNFVDDGSVFGDVANDGIYVARANPAEFTISAKQGSGGNTYYNFTTPTGKMIWANDHILLNVTVRDSSGLKANTDALISPLQCMDAKNPESTGGHTPHVTGTTTVDVCTVCHLGEEHFYENISGTIPNSELDVHFQMVPNYDVGSQVHNKDFGGTYRWNVTDYRGTAATENWSKTSPGSQYCYFCHTYKGTSSVIMSYGYMDTSSSTPRSNPSDVPLCNNSNCHPSTEMQQTASPSWIPAGLTSSGWGSTPSQTWPNANIFSAKSHNRSSERVPCALCHGTQHGYGLPNSSKSTTVEPINEQCWLCHNISGGLNITSNGGTNVAHTSKECASCHYDSSNKLDVHDVPTGQSGGRNCTECHDIGKDFAKVDVGKMNLSNSIHLNLNKNATLTAGVRVENKFCWGCHTNSSVGSDNIVNENELPANTHPNGFDTPKKCTECHIQSKFGALIVNEHFSASTDINTRYYANINDSCINCHNKSEMILSNNDPSGPKSQYAYVSHYGDNKTNDVPYILNSNANCSYCHQNITSAFKSEMSDPSWNSSISNHSALSTNPDCTNNNCHNSGRIHYSNLVKPVVSSTLCKNCHTSKEQHNGTLECSQCHLNTNKNIHPVQYLQPGGTFKTNSLENKTSAVNCTDCHQGTGLLNAPLVPDKLNHSTDRNGTKWGTYWTSTKDACIYCHGDNKHNATRLGNASVPVGIDTIGGPIGSGTVCSSCHNPSDSDYAATMALFARDPVGILLNQANWNNSGTDHASYGTTDEACKSCHNGALSSQSASISEFVHNVDVGKGGGPNCVSCHDIGASQENVDVSKMNTPTSIHNILNSGATMTTSGADNKRCYACHTNNTVSAGGVVNEADLPTSGHPDGYNTPKKCTQCHDQGNFSALIVSEHNSAGSEIKTMQYATTNDSCVNCHNKTEMIISNSDPGGVKSIFASVSHYGSNKTLDPLYNTGSTSNCTYCHQNPSGTFTTEMVNALWNASIDNHTELGSNPGCTSVNCHSSGRIHESTLTKPALTLPDSSYCQNCHSILSKQKHNGSVDCTDCHLATNKNIHPVQYLQPGGTFKTNSPENKTSAVNCTDCHQGTGLLNAPKVQTPLNHSNDPLAGQKWNNYWTSGTGGSAQLSACVYCHGATQHDQNALGRPSQFDGNNVIGSTISDTTYWCSSCHWQGYTSGANNYNDMVNIFISLNVPPEITGHSTYGANQSKPGYFNHSIVAKDDASCKGCHGGLTPSTNITGLLHNVFNISEGSPSPPLNITLNQSIGLYDTRLDKYPESLCRNCHNSTYLGGVFTRHHNLVDGIQINPTNGQIFSCQDCHPNIIVNGNQQPLYDRNCINCHNGTAFWGNTLGAQVNLTRPHHINTSYDNAGIGEPAQTRQCNVCHGSFVANYNDSHYIPSYNTSFMITPYADFKAYNETSGRYWGGCYACHQNSSSESPVIMTQHDTHHSAISGWEGIGHQKDSTPGYSCTWCHLSLDVQNATVNITINGAEKTVMELRNSTLMAADIANATFEQGTTMPINGTACEKCHSVKSLHNIQAVNNGQPGNGHIGNNSDCMGCHASWIAGAAPMQGAIIPSVDSITPSVVLAGSVNDIIITGVNFVNDAYTSIVSVDGVTYKPASITDTQIVVNIPALSAGVHTLQLVKKDEKSKLATLTVVTQTTIASAKLESGSITITGTNFGPKPDPAFSDLGVFITQRVKGKPAIFRATVISWSDTSIVVDAGTAVANDQLTVKDLNGQASTKVTKGK